MIQTHSEDPDVAAAAREAAVIVQDVLNSLPAAESFDYGGHELRLGDYAMCTDCTSSIAEAQAAHQALQAKAESLEDQTVEEHVELAAELMRKEAEAATIRAELHSGHGSEPIVNELLGFIYNRNIHDRPEHSHEGGEG